MKRYLIMPLLALMLIPGLLVKAQTNSNPPKEPISIKITGNKSVGNEPIYVVDGKVTDAQLNNLNPDQIASITVLKDASAVNLYGPEARNGVIIVATKKSAAAVASEIIGDGGNGTKVILRGTNVPGKNPVYVVNGEIVTESDLLLIEPNKIQTVEILKNASAVALYGPEATNGVIIVTTKKESTRKTKN